MERQKHATEATTELQKKNSRFEAEALR